MFDELSQRSQPPSEFLYRLENFCTQYVYRLQQQIECVKGDTFRERLRRKAEQIMDLPRSMRLWR